MKRFLTFSVFSIISLHCFSQCDSAFFRQTATAVYDVSLISDKIIIGVGYNGYIIKSTDGGNSWRNIPNSYGDFTFRTVEFTGDSTGYAAGDGGIMKTEDQGETWYKLLSPLFAGYNTTYYDMHFFNKDSGIFTGRDGHVLFTTDGGRNFKDTLISGYNVYTIDFINDSTGLMGSSGIYKTTDGGKTWRTIDIENLGVPGIKKIRFVTPSFAAASGSNGIFATSSDGGETWTPVTANPNVNGINDFYFFDENNGIAMGDALYNSLLLHTSDGGKTFTINWDDPQDNSLFSFNTDPQKKKLMAVGGSSINAESNARNIIVSTDKGNSWSVLSNNKETGYYYTQFVNDSTGFISGGDNFIYKTNNYGETWIKTGMPVTSLANVARNFYFTDSLHGYAVTEDLSYTSNGGKTWTATNLPDGVYGDAPQFVLFYNSLKGIACYRDSIYYTDDGANSWQTSTIPTDNLSSRINSITRTPNGRLFTCGEYGKIMQSADEGKTWSAVNISNETLMSIYFYNDTTGFIGTSNNVIYKTIDGGLTWNSIALNTYNKSVRSFAFSDALHGFMLINEGQASTSAFYYTEDGGSKWNPAFGISETVYNLSGFTNIYAAGGDGFIIKTDHAVKPAIPGYINGVTKLCDSSTSVYAIAGGNNLTYTWSVTPKALQQTGSTTDTIQWKGGGQYTVAVAASNVCGTGPARTQLIDIINFKPQITATDSVLTVTKGQGYTWYLNDTIIQTGTADSNAIVIAHRNGIYKAAVINELGCTGITDTIDYSSYLPFELISFSGASSSDKSVNLQWVVANERSDLYNVIERGNDSVHFTAIDSLAAQNNYNTGDTYTYNDHTAVAGLNFYRIKFTGTGGTARYSNAIPVTVDKEEIPGIFPNPATNVITIYKRGETVNAVTIYNSQGTPVIIQSYSTGQTSVTLDIRSLKHGLYYIKIKTSKNTYTERLLLM